MDTTVLANKKVLITAGPTREAIDPVRYISNHSSGKMGYAIADAFLNLGAQVILVSGPVSVQLQHPRLQTINVDSASEMHAACCQYFEKVDIAVFAAAVADYRPIFKAEKKIKKESGSFTIRLVKNVDIAFEFGQTKRPDQISVGFALETNDEFRHAKNKLLKKNMDLVILNSMNDPGAGFAHDTNRITVIRKNLTRKGYPLKKKKEVATDIVKEIFTLVMEQLQYEEMRID
jgi:phosphopantothenoylcysteine decarboxylase/phosphopantothenate--cysteine ligase